MNPDGLNRAIAAKLGYALCGPFVRPITVLIKFADGVAVNVAVNVVASLVKDVLLHVAATFWHDGLLAVAVKPQTLFVPTCAKSDRLFSVDAAVRNAKFNPTSVFVPPRGITHTVYVLVSP